MGREYEQLTLEERRMLFRLHEAGTAVGEKADGSYLPEIAHRFAWERHLRGSKLERRSQLSNHVRDRLARRASRFCLPGLPFHPISCTLRRPKVA